MKLSVWQQFSSNHSSGFIVVGEFATHVDAKNAVARLREILKNLTDWHTQHEEETRDWWGSGDWADDPSPPEKELARQYNIEWAGAIDWFSNTNIDIVLEHLVYITPGQRPEADGQPFDQVINRLGGKGYHEGNIYGDDTGWITFDLICNAPDENIATAVYNRYLGFNRRIKRSGVKLHFYSWRFNEYPDLPTLVAALRTEGCTEIQYEFKQIIPGNGSKLHNIDDLDVLIEVLIKSSDTEERQKAADVLGEIGDARATAALIVALQDSDGWLRRAAARALGNIGSVSAVDPLLEQLSDSDAWTRSVVIVALSRIADSKSIKPLINTLNDDQLWEEVVNALGRFGTLALKPLQEAHIISNGIGRSRIEMALERVQETIQGGKLLADMRNEDEAVARSAFEQVQALSDVDTMLDFLRNPGTGWQSILPNHVIEALIQLKDERLIPLLVDRISYFGQTSIVALTKIGTPAVGALINLAQNHSEAWMRQSALYGLATIGDMRAFDMLVKALDTPDNIQRRIAAVGLGKIGDRRAAKPLINALFQSWEHWHPEVVAAIFQSIQQVGGASELVETLITRLQTSGWMLGNVVQMLGDLGDKRAIEPLTSLLGTADENMKEIIERSLRKLEQSNSTVL